MAKLVTILFIYYFFKGLTAPYLANQVRWKVNSDFSDMVLSQQTVDGEL